MSLSNRTRLSVAAGIEIYLVEKNAYTHYLELSTTVFGKTKLLQILPIDPTDNTVLGSLSPETIHSFGNDAPFVLNVLANTLQNTLGAKEIVAIPANITLPGFTHAAEYQKCNRLRVTNQAALVTSAINYLTPYKNLVHDLDKQLNVVTSIDGLLESRDPYKRYQEIAAILNAARFTDGKQTEYQTEDLQGKLSRFHNGSIKPIVMLDAQGNIAGMVRAVMMDNGFAYLSDEVVNQNILPLSEFAGLTEDEQKTNRECFLLSYLMVKAAEQLAELHTLIIIAASGREALYEKVGFTRSPAVINGYQIVMNFGAPEHRLVDIKEKIAGLPLPEKLNDLGHSVSLATHHATQFSRRCFSENVIAERENNPKFLRR